MKNITAIVLSCLLLNIVSGESVTLPNTFTQGTPARASEVNANFAALANAVNDSPKPLMVYDSTGKVVGQYYPNSCESCTNGSVDQTEISQPIVTVSTLGAAFKVRISSNVYSSIETQPSLKSFFNNSPNGDDLGFVSSDCSGQSFLLAPLYATTDILAPPALVISNKAYILDGLNKVGTWVHGSVHSLKAENGYCFELEPAGKYTYMFPVSRIVDLSVFIPPFSVH